jgi:hypothetical protein
MTRAAALGRAALLACAFALPGMLAACSKDAPSTDAPPPVTTPPIVVPISVEVLDRGTVSLPPDGGAVVVDLAGHGYGIVDASAPLRGAAKHRSLADANVDVWSAVLTTPPLTGGRCGDAPVSLALSLVRRGSQGATLAGSLTAYCGDTPAGRPLRVLRIAEVAGGG